MREIERRRSAEALERIMFALRHAREPHDVLAIAARGIAFEFARPCAAYELRDRAFRPVVASEVTSIREPIRAASLDLDRLRANAVTRASKRDLIPVSSDGKLRALFILEDAGLPLEEEDTKFLEAVSAHAALALTTALSFEQLRRYAAEGAALTEAARTILNFTELEPLADALCRLAFRLVRAETVCLYGRRDGTEGLVLISCEPAAKRNAVPATLPPKRDAALAAIKKSVGEMSLAVMPTTFPDTADREHGGLLVIARSRRAFEKAEIRVIEALVTLAALAIRNVELYEQSTRANRALAESNAFKDDLMAMFAHDFKGPLTVISGFAELMLETGDGEIRSGAETIIEQTRRLAKLAEDALALAATQSAGFSLRRRRQDLVAFVRDAVRGLNVGAERITIDAPKESVIVPFDRARLRHVIDNVVGNALKYSKEDVGIRIFRAEGEAVVEVVDRGIGIPEAEMQRIFSRFGRGSNARAHGITGSGVGLYIAKKIVEVHRGHLDVASRQNEGSTFTVALPLD
jgi:K+-sensing histidine kinase KdpD